MINMTIELAPSGDKQLAAARGLVARLIRRPQIQDSPGVLWPICRDEGIPRTTFGVALKEEGISIEEASLACSAMGIRKAAKTLVKGGYSPQETARALSELYRR